MRGGGRRGLSFAVGRDRWAKWHDLIEQNGLAFTVLVLVAILVGGVVQIIPTVVITNRVPEQVRAYQDEVLPAGGEEDPAMAESAKWMQQPYSPLELAGRDVYVAEGCYTCHSQMIRPFRHEVLRYGDYSRLEESLLDHPFQWGTKRTGPDLARGRRQVRQPLALPAHDGPAVDLARLEHAPVHLAEGAAGRLRRHQGPHADPHAKLGVPYDEADFLSARQDGLSQGQLIVDDLATQSVELAPDSKMVALIAYLQRLGKRGACPPRASGPQIVAAAGAQSMFQHFLRPTARCLTIVLAAPIGLAVFRAQLHRRVALRGRSACD